MGVSGTFVGERGRRLPDTGAVLHCGGTCRSIIWFGYVGYVPMNWKELERIPPRGGQQTNGLVNAEGNIWDVGIPPAGGGDGRGGPE